ncbi:MAG: FtsX-like permease family protein [Ilumatobacteraceae bacterium]
MLSRYVIADLVRNPRRTLSTMIGVALGVGLFCGVLFFVDGLSASMTQRAIAPLAIDMQRIVAEPTGATLTLTQAIDPVGHLAPDDEITVDLTLSNVGEVDANEVIVRSQPSAGLAFVPGSATVDDTPITTVDDNPLAHGSGQTGYNLGTIPPTSTRRLTYRLVATANLDVDAGAAQSTYSSREHVAPTAAGRPVSTDLRDLAVQLATIDGVAAAAPLSIADLGTDTLTHDSGTVGGPVKIFGLDAGDVFRDAHIEVVGGRLSADGAVLSVEAAARLGVGVGGTVTLSLPDGTARDIPVTGVADLSRSRLLFSSRRGGDLETFVYVPNSVIVSSTTFAELVQPAFDRAAVARDGRLKSPPIREIDISLDRERLQADPAAALVETTRIGGEVGDVAAGSGDYVLDNISNTLSVANDDAAVAKRLFVFLGIPGGVLAIMLVTYAGTVLTDAQRRERAVLRIRGANREHLLRMLATRTGLITGGGSVVGLVCGYAAAAVFLGRDALDRASPSSLAVSALVGVVSGLLATGLALYVTGRRSIDREINEDRAVLDHGVPLWCRARLDLIGAGAVVLASAVAIRADAFAGARGSVYFGRSVELNLPLLALPLLVWITGSLLAARLVGHVLDRLRPASTATLARPLVALYRRSIGRRPWAIANAVLIVSLIVGLTTCLAAFTSSYDAAKRTDARYATGADIRITPGPAASPPVTAEDAARFQTDGVRATTPVIYGLSNVILRSTRTSDPANVVAIDPVTYPLVAPLTATAFTGSGGTAFTDADAAVRSLQDDRTAVFLSRDMATFLRVGIGDTLEVLLARATDAQTEVQLHVDGLFERLPGFPDGADALMAISAYTEAVPTKNPDYFLAATGGGADLEQVVEALTRSVGDGQVQIETRATTLATDQSSLAALNIAGLTDLDASFSLAMTVATIAIFVFGLLLHRRREYVTLRAQGFEPRSIRILIALEAVTVAVAGSAAGTVVGVAMGAYFVAILRPLFVLTPVYTVSVHGTLLPIALVLAAAFAATLGGSHVVDRLDPTELLRDE